VLLRYADKEGGGFFDRATDAPAMGGLDLRRKPFQDSPTPSANSAAIIALVRMHAFTGDERYRAFAKKTLETFSAIALQYGLFAATYGLAATLFVNHPIQIVVTGVAGDPAAQALGDAAHRVYRFGKSVLRLVPGISLDTLSGALKQTLPHLPTDKAVAIVCAGQTCMPPVINPDQLIAQLEKGAADAARR
jgi:uncharacterized protein YyaL (SSP411 family)